MFGQVRKDMLDILRKLCDYKKIEILAGAIRPDHVHMCVRIPPGMRVSDFVGYLKGKSALMIFDRYPNMGNKWSRSFWARGYYVCTVGNMTIEVIKKYIQEQEEEDRRTSN